ncbi:OLC1v1022270C1 [Oldenlandia corymbosa var. corymbosa]|uniref:OLC1v1022270C1 n=1 Tax=Oldenlandia corymbosa var. corymbosa TaxID=529605 RepID=A0AAV1BY66_OLDCO|nr:OLC1v1022270C1 [Oldenlandia corymbosa var. corymbosa]
MGCEACRFKTKEVLSSIIGVYNVDMDGQNGLVRVYGEVDPNMLLHALARYGKHAEVVRVNFKHPEWTRTNDFHGGHGSCNASDLGYSFPRSLAADNYYSPVFSPDYPIRGSGLSCGLPPRHRRFAASHHHHRVPPHYLRRDYGLCGRGGYYRNSSCTCPVM